MTTSTARKCRVCEGIMNLRNIFIPGSKITVKRLRACADIELSEGDELPKFICGDCFLRLDSSYKFKIQCEYTDRKLRDAIEAEKLKKDKPPDPDDELQEIGFVVENDLGKADDAFKDEKYLIDVESNGRVSADEYIEDDEKQQSIDESHFRDVEDLENPEIIPQYIEEITETRIVDDSLDKVDEKQQETTAETLPENIDSSKLNVLREEEDYHGESTHRKGKSRRIGATRKQFECETCSEVLSNFTDYNAHKKKHGKNRYQCLVCNKWLPKRYLLKIHMSTHLKDQEFPCSMCHKKYANKGNLDRHVRHFHNQEKPYLCTICGASFSRLTILKQHYVVHSVDRNFECEECRKKFKTMYYLDIHRKSHVPLSQRQPHISSKKKTLSCVCPYCGKKSSNTFLYKSHLRTHTGEKPYECTICHKKFSFSQSLKTHLLLHTGEKPYKCDMCDASFRQIGHLNGHKLVHSGIKPNKCKFCDKFFALKSNLLVHMRLHTGDTPYKCETCEKKFYTSNSLKRHRVQHSKDETRREQSDVVTETKEDEGTAMNVYVDTEGNEYTEIIEMQDQDTEIKVSSDGGTYDKNGILFL